MKSLRQKLRKILFFELSPNFCKKWHNSMVFGHVVGALLVAFFAGYDQHGTIQAGVLAILVTLFAGTLAMGIFWIAVIIISIATRFGVILLPFIYFGMMVHNWFGGDNNVGWCQLWISIGSVIWFWFNVRTAVIANREYEYNPVIIIEDW